MNANGTEKKKHSSENSVFVICIYIKTFSPLNIDIPLVKIFFTNLTFQSIFELRFQYLRNIRKESLKLLHIRKGWGGGGQWPGVQWVSLCWRISFKVRQIWYNCSSRF